MALSELPPAAQDALVGALRRGDPAAFERLYEALHARVYNLAARILGDREDAADITQEVFLAAYRHLPGHEGEMRLQPWLYRVTVNMCYDHQRRRSRRPADPIDDPETLPGTVDDVERSQLSTAVSDALDELNPRYRAALVLKDIHGCGNAELAEILDVSRGAAGVVLFRARKAFRQAFRKISHDGAARVSALGLAPFLPTLPVPPALQTPPDFSSVATGDAVPAPHGVDATPPDAASSASGGPAADPSASALLGDPALQGQVMETAAAAAPAAGCATTGIAAKLGSAAVSKTILAVVGIAALAGGGATVGSLVADDGAAPHERGASGTRPTAAAPGIRESAIGAGGDTVPGQARTDSPVALRSGPSTARDKEQASEGPNGPQTGGTNETGNGAQTGQSGKESSEGTGGDGAGGDGSSGGGTGAGDQTSGTGPQSGSRQASGGVGGSTRGSSDGGDPALDGGTAGSSSGAEIRGAPAAPSGGGAEATSGSDGNDAGADRSGSDGS